MTNEFKKQNPKNDTISLLCLEERSTLESIALRGALEYLGYIVSTHWVGSKESFLKLLSGGVPDNTVIISGHGYKRGFLAPDEKIIKPDEFKNQIKWKDKDVISLGCCTGTKEFADAFIKGGVKTYIAPNDYPDGNATLVFAMYFFFLLRKGDNVKVAFEKSKQLDKQLNSFMLYENISSL